MNFHFNKSIAHKMTEGDMFTIGRSGRLFLDHYPAMKREFTEISIHDGWMRYRKHTGEAIGDALPFSKLVGGQKMSADDQPMVTQLRPLFHQMLYRQIKRFGIKIQYEQQVVEYYEDEERSVGGVVLKNGERMEADLVIAADGLGSKSQHLVLGGESKGKPSGRSIFRAAWPLEMAEKDPVVKEYFGLKDGKYPMMQGWLGPDTHAMSLSYVDKNGQNGLMCWGLTFTEPGEQSTTESWHYKVSTDDVLKILEQTPGWGEPMIRLVKTMPEGSIVFWPLLWRNPTRTTCSAACFVVQIGDAAHSFLPTSGNGATQAIEDAVTIAACLQRSGKDKLALGVATHSLLRSDRVSCAQRLGFHNAERYHKQDMEKVGSDPEKVKARVPKWIFMLDPEKYVDENYNTASASLCGGPEFINTNIPPGYTPDAWTLEGVEKLHAEGKGIELTGDWS